MNAQHGRAAALGPLAGLGLALIACALLVPEPWRGGVTAALVVLAGAIVVAFARRQSAEIDSLRAAATIDPLTGLLNRSGYQAQIEMELARAERHGTEFAFLVIDVDDFKAVNDRLGHLGGDMALQRVGGQIRRTGRTGDVAARLGGDEFAVILPRTDELGAVTFASRLCAQVRESFAGTATDLTLSVGIAHYPDGGRSAEELLHAADMAMYRAKELGKDRVAVHRGPKAAGDTRRPLIQVA